MRGCALGDEGILELARGWPFKHLRSLSVANNKIGSAGAEALAVLLTASPSLETLLIGENEFDATGDLVLLTSSLDF